MLRFTGQVPHLKNRDGVINKADYEKGALVKETQQSHWSRKGLEMTLHGKLTFATVPKVI